MGTVDANALQPYAILSLDIGGTKIAGAIVSYDQKHMNPITSGYRSIPTCANQGGATVLARALSLAQEILEDSSRLTHYPIKGIGISSSGRISRTDGSVAYANEILPGWTGQPIQYKFESTFNLPVAVLNDAQAYALGELHYGAAQGCKTGIVVAIGTGLGGALIIDGHVLSGAHGFAGELGHTITPYAAGIVCSCGCKGHLESIASGSGIEACYRAAGGDNLSGAKISERAFAGEELALKIIKQAGLSLGESIGSWAIMIDPDVVVISGSVTKAGSIWREALQQGVDAQLPDVMKGLPIVEATLGNYAPLIGAAEKVITKRPSA